MSDLVLIAFDEPSKAFDLCARLAELQKEYLISMEDSANIGCRPSE